MEYYGAAVSDTGIRKSTNQDSVLLKIAETETGIPVVMAVVCDGMGGLSKGELASATVIRMLDRWFTAVLPYRVGKVSLNDMARELERMIRAENQRIMEYGKKIHQNLGTTLALLLIEGTDYLTANVGDSRVYCLAEKLEQQTEDQTFVAREVKKGTMTMEDAMKDSRRNMLLQCIGASRTVTPDFSFGTVAPETVYMLCSDGFRHVLTPDEIYENLNYAKCGSVSEMEKNGKELVEMVKARGEKDNISMLLVKCGKQ